MIGVFLYYGCTVDFTMLTALSAVVSSQAKPTEETMTWCKQFLDYAATHQDTIITYKKSDMVLVVHSDASYLSKLKARSRAGGHFFLLSNVEDPIDNGAILNLAQLIKAIMSSAAEAELGALFINARKAVPQFHNNAHLRRWATSNLPLQCRPTTQQPLALWTTTFNPDAPKPWIWDSIGTSAEKPKTDSGIPDQPTRLTTGPSTTVQHTTSKSNMKSSRTRVYWRPFTLPWNAHQPIQQQPLHKHTYYALHRRYWKGVLDILYLATWDYGIPT